MEAIDGLDVCDDPLSPTHADLRSSEKAANRQRKQKQKYYAYRGVHPSWIGQQYYTLTLVSEEPLALAANQKTKQPHAPAVVETEHEDLLNQLLKRQHSLIDMTLPGSIHQALAEARAAGYTPAHPTSKHERHTAGSADTDTLTTAAPISLTRLTETLHGIAPPEHQPHLPKYKLKIKVATWTKHDNFAHKEHFIVGPDRRHSRSRRIREWMNRHTEAERLGRTARQRGQQGRAIREEEEEEEQEVVVDSDRDISIDGAGAGAGTLGSDRARPGPVTCPGEDDTADGAEQAETVADGTLSVLESLLGSAEAVVASRTRLDADAEDGSSSIEFDVMSDSDLADILGGIDIEWDMLSDVGTGTG